MFVAVAVVSELGDGGKLACLESENLKIDIPCVSYGRRELLNYLVVDVEADTAEQTHHHLSINYDQLANFLCFFKQIIKRRQL